MEHTDIKILKRVYEKGNDLEYGEGFVRVVRSDVSWSEWFFTDNKVCGDIDGREIVQIRDVGRRYRVIEDYKGNYTKKTFFDEMGNISNTFEDIKLNDLDVRITNGGDYWVVGSVGKIDTDSKIYRMCEAFCNMVYKRYKQKQ